ncbi:hypothetical protein DL771_000030 [Monosporascus sp. 5C6A]|nr:hypothetical protein DL771_000030 [Monosporascus sp. 5C6A]
MTGLNPDSFERALNTFKQSLSPSLARQFSDCKLEDVKDVIRGIQQKQGKEGRLRDMRRLGAFIEAIEQFGKVVEVFVNANEFVCFIWGPIKFLLGIARTHLDSFDRLLDAYSQIGDAIPGLLAYKATFERHPALAAVLEDYYSDILRFHQEALCVFNRSRWKNLLHATWKTFDSKFNPILHSLASRRELLESEKTSACLYGIQALRESIDKAYREQTRQATEMNFEKHKSRITQIKQRLRAPDYQTDQEIHTEDRNGSASGQWIFKDPKFLSWSDKTSPGHRVLYVNGIPGAGKTTLMSTVIEKLLNEMQSKDGSTRNPVAYFYFKHGQKDKTKHNEFLRVLLTQLLDHDTAMSQQSYEDLSFIAEENLRSTKTLETQIKNAFGAYQASFLVLDGLDECGREEAEKTVEWLLSLVSGGLETPSTSLRIIFSGQRDGVLDKLLTHQPSITLESSEHLKDIVQYCQTFCKRIQAKFNTSPALEQEILKLVTGEAKVLDNLLHQTSTRRLKREVQPETFPRGLDSAYDRVIARVLEHPSEAVREDAMRVLSLVICAKRALRWREIQAFFCISPEDSEIDHDRFLQLGCKELCGSLVDAHHVDDNAAGPEDIIQIVHETAQRRVVVPAANQSN